MKQTLKTKKTVTRPKKTNQFVIELDAKGIGFFLIMGLIAALLVFYLGYVFGKATRDPNAPPMQAQEQIKADADAQETTVQKNLKIFNIKEDEGNRIEDLKKAPLRR